MDPGPLILMLILQNAEDLKNFITSFVGLCYAPETEQILREGDRLVAEGDIENGSAKFNDLIAVKRYRAKALGYACLSACSSHDGSF